MKDAKPSTFSCSILSFFPPESAGTWHAGHCWAMICSREASLPVRPSTLPAHYHHHFACRPRARHGNLATLVFGAIAVASNQSLKVTTVVRTLYLDSFEARHRRTITVEQSCRSSYPYRCREATVQSFLGVSRPILYCPQSKAEQRFVQSKKAHKRKRKCKRAWQTGSPLTDEPPDPGVSDSSQASTGTTSKPLARASSPLFPAEPLDIPPPCPSRR